MGLSEAKRKTRLVGSAITNNAAWTNDASLPGQRMLSSMGWTQGQGLGTSSQGTAAPITMAFKMDNKGIGARRFEKEARANGKADAWIGGAGQLGDLFERLNQTSNLVQDSESNNNNLSKFIDENASELDSSSKKGKSRKREKGEEKEKKDRKGKGKEQVEEKEKEANQSRVEEAVEKVASTLPNRMAHRARFLKAKRMVGTDLASVNEILGIASTAGSSGPIDEFIKSTPESSLETNKQQLDELETKKDKKHKRKREEEKPDIATTREEKKARKEAKRQAKEVRREAKEEKKKKKRQPEGNTRTEDIYKPNLEASSDPSFEAGGGMKVSTMSVHEYLQSKLMKRRAAIVRQKREEDASLWNRVATACS